MKRRKHPDLLSKTLCTSLAVILLSMIIAQWALAKTPVAMPTNSFEVGVFTIEDKADKYNFIFIG